MNHRDANVLLSRKYAYRGLSIQKMHDEVVSQDRDASHRLECEGLLARRNSYSSRLSKHLNGISLQIAWSLCSLMSIESGCRKLNPKLVKIKAHSHKESHPCPLPITLQNGTPSGYMTSLTTLTARNASRRLLSASEIYENGVALPLGGGTTDGLRDCIHDMVQAENCRPRLPRTCRRDHSNS